MANPAIGIRDLLVSAGIGVFAATSGWSIAIGKEPAAPDTAVTVYNTGGLGSNPKWLLDEPTVQVSVRGAKNGYVASRAKVQAVKDALLGLPSQDLNGDRWVSVTGIGDINDLGFDESNRSMHTVNFKLILEPSSGTHRASLPGA